MEHTGLVLRSAVGVRSPETHLRGTEPTPDTNCVNAIMGRVTRRCFDMHLDAQFPAVQFGAFRFEL